MDRMLRFAAVLGLIISVGCLLPASAFSADTTPEGPPHEIVPQTEPGTGSGSSEPLGDRLERSNGVIRPPSGVDPGLTQPPPQSGSRTPVIAPPGTPGGKPDVNPK